MTRIFKRFIREANGATTLEMSLAAALVAIAIIGMAKAMGAILAGQYVIMASSG